MFTGDRSGEWLYAALHRAGLANQAELGAPRRRPAAARRLRHRGRPLRAAGQQADHRRSATTASPIWSASWSCSTAAGSIVALGAFGWDGVAAGAARAIGVEVPRPKPRFGHGAEAELGAGALLGCYHPSQQNTFTGKLTEPMIDAAISRAVVLSR